MNLIEKVKQILFSPNTFFSDVEKERRLNKAFIFFIILSAFSAILSSIILFFWRNAYTMFFPIDLSVMPYKDLAWPLLTGFLISIPLSFVSAGVLYIWLKIFKGKRPYREAYKLYVYSKTPNFILGWIPIINLLSWIYSFVLLIIGTHKMYKFSGLKATLIYLIPTIIISFIVLIFLLIAVAFLFSAGLDPLQPTF
ncbi:MAG: YIP1 family protein [Nanoarchaeota archaeon]